MKMLSEMTPAGDGVSLILSIYERHIEAKIWSLGGGSQVIFFPPLDLSSRRNTNNFYYKIVIFIKKTMLSG